MRNTGESEAEVARPHINPSQPTTAAMTATVASPSVGKVALFDQEDSGLGSFNYPSNSSSFGLEERLDSMDPPHTSSSDINPAFRDAPQSQQPLLSITSELNQLNLNESDIGLDRPDRARLTALSRGHGGQNSNLSCDFDSCYFSNTPSCPPDIMDDISEMENKQTLKEREDSGVVSQTVPVDERSWLTPQQRVEVYTGDKDGDNYLHLSIIHGRETLAMYVIDQAPDYMWISHSNLLRQTPLHLAVLTSQPRLVRRLICAGAIVDAQDSRGDTPLHLACSLGNEEIIKQLLRPVRFEETLENKWEDPIPFQRLPQDLSIRNYEGRAPLHSAVLSGHENVVRLLLQAGADPNIGDAKSGRTALHFAAEWGRLNIAELLLATRGVDLARQNYAGFTASQLARGRGLYPLATFLQPESEADLSDADSEMTLVHSSDSDDSDTEWLDCGMQ